ncbi:MAG: hypothetical protein EOQ89_03600 [Mesorhizobium sp.]|nr:MAG: hypothetical protein EOQ89_03600 [Mesorhizobium sp.]
MPRIIKKAGSFQEQAQAIGVVLTEADIAALTQLEDSTDTTPDELEDDDAEQQDAHMAYWTYDSPEPSL